MKSPIRIFDGTAKPHEPFWRLRNAEESESGEPEIEFYGVISEYSWWGDEITPAKFKEDLRKLGNKGPITVRMNSGGGDVIAASVIRSVLVDYPGQVTVRIDGLCASAATFVAMAGDVVKMQDTAFFMIHDPSVIAWGTVEDLKKAIDLLKTVKSGIIDAYTAKTNLSNEKLSKMMSDETWMTAQGALENGFIDEVIAVPGKVELEPIQNLAIMNYVNVPEALKVSEPVNSAIAEDEMHLRDEIYFLRRSNER